jgi:hypothetical protein
MTWICDCFSFGCGFCKHTTDANNAGCRSKEGGQATCATNNGTWYLEYPDCNLASCSYSTVCDCTNDTNCGWCSGHKLVEGVEKVWAYCKNKAKIVYGDENYCVDSMNGTWAYGEQVKCQEHIEGEHEAEVKGELNSVPDATTTEAIEKVIQKIVSDKLGVNLEKVEVVVAVETKSDGTISFTVKVKVDGAVVSGDKFSSGIASILSDSVQSSMVNEGVDVKSVNSIEAVEVASVAGKFVVSLIIGFMVLLM